MRQLSRVSRRVPGGAAGVALGVIVLLASGCGSQAERHNAQRPPIPIVVSASIDDNAVSVSPRSFGAGPITLVISNQSSASQQVTLETADEPGGGPGRRAVQTGPINPRETASVQADVDQGMYALSVGGSGVSAARLTVQGRRASAQNTLQTP